VIALRSWVLFCLVGCGSSEAAQSRETTPARLVRADLTDALPADATVVGRADVASLRRSPRWSEISGLLERVLAAIGDDDQERALAQIATTLLPRVDELVFAMSESEDATVPLVLASGTFEPAELRTALASIAPDVQESTADGVTQYRAGAIAANDLGGIWIVGSAERVERATRIVRGAAPAVPLESRALAAMFDRARADSAHLGAAALPTDRTRALVAELLHPDAAVLASVQTFGLTGRLEDGLRAAVLIETNDPIGAGALSDSASAQLDALAGNVMLAMFGVRELVQAIRVETRESTAIATVELDGEATSRLVNRFGGAIVLIIQAARDARDAAPARDAAEPSPVLQLDE
jgi:hypothetical protein